MTTTTRRRPKARTFRRKEVYTTGDVAVLTGFSATTVGHLIDRGFIRGWRIPGGQDRRVGERELRRWLTRTPGMEDILARLEAAS